MSRDEQLYLAAIINADRVQKLLELRHSAHQQQQTKGASSSSTSSKPTIYVKSRSSYSNHKKLGELGAIIRGTSYPSVEPIFQTKGASVVRKPGPIEREIKLKELGKMVRSR